MRISRITTYQAQQLTKSNSLPKATASQSNNLHKATADHKQQLNKCNILPKATVVVFIIELCNKVLTIDLNFYQFLVPLLYFFPSSKLMPHLLSLCSCRHTPPCLPSQHVIAGSLQQQLPLKSCTIKFFYRN